MKTRVTKAMLATALRDVLPYARFKVVPPFEESKVAVARAEHVLAMLEQSR